MWSILLASTGDGAAAAESEIAAQEPSPSSLAASPVAEAPRLDGMVQMRHETVVDGRGNLNETGFVLARARLALTGRFGPKVEYHISGAADLGSPQLFAAFVGYSPWRFFTLRAGQMRVPFGRSAATPEELLVFPERSVSTREFAYTRDVGVSASAQFWANRLELVVGAYNGAGPNRVNDNRDPMLLLRLAGVPIGQAWQPAEGDPGKTRNVAVTLGGTMTIDYVPAPTGYGYASGSAVPVRVIANRDVDQNGHVDDVRVVQLAADLALRFRGLGFECELYQRKEAWKQIPNQPGPMPFQVQSRFRGWFAQLSYFILAERLQVAARVGVARLSPLSLAGQTRPETSCLFDSGATAPCQLPYADVRSELAGLVAFQYTRLRVSGTYSRLRWSTDGAVAPAPATENRITLQAQWVL